MYHTIILVGNLGRDPEMRYTPSGQAVTNFYVATNRQYTAADGTQVKETIWFRVSTWGRRRGLQSVPAQRHKVLVEGRLIPDPTDRRTPVCRADGPGASFEVSASMVRFLSGRNDDDGGYQATDTFGGGLSEPDEIPF